MKITLRRLSVSALGFLLLTMLYACLVPDAGYVGGVYVEPGYESVSYTHLTLPTIYSV